jgi:hypothetical protein
MRIMRPVFTTMVTGPDYIWNQMLLAQTFDVLRAKVPTMKTTLRYW